MRLDELFMFALMQHFDLLLFLVILSALRSEILRGFTGRPSLVANTISIFISYTEHGYRISPIVYNKWLGLIRLGDFMYGYVLVGICCGFIAFLSYMFEKPMKTEFYTATWICYNSIFALGICGWLKTI